MAGCGSAGAAAGADTLGEARGDLEWRGFRSSYGGARKGTKDKGNAEHDETTEIGPGA